MGILLVTTVHCTSMYPYLLLLCIVSTYSTYIPLCQFTVQKYVETLELDSSIDQQSAAMLPICSQLEDDEARRHCQRSVQSYWSYLAPELYNANINTQEVVDWICNINFGPSDQCEQCTLTVSYLASLFTNEEVVSSMVAMVQGDLFCDMDNAWWDVPTCQEEWAWFLPQAGPVLRDLVTEGTWSLEFCTDHVLVCH